MTEGCSPAGKGKNQGLAPPDHTEESTGPLDGSYKVSAPCYHNHYLLSQRFQALLAFVIVILYPPATSL